MKNFEKYLDDISEEMARAGCILPVVSCPYGHRDCAECFKRWAMEEVEEEEGEKE